MGVIIIIIIIITTIIIIIIIIKTLFNEGMHVIVTITLINLWPSPRQLKP